MTCAVDKVKCPSGSEAELRTINNDIKVSSSRKWLNFDIRYTTYCKLSIKHQGQYTTDRFKFNNMNIKIDSL